MTATAHSPATTFVLDALRHNPEATFAELKARAALEGIVLQPLVYGRAKKELGLIALRAMPKDREIADEESQQEVQDMADGSESAENGAPETVAETETVVGPELLLEPAPMPPPNSHDGSSAPAPRRRQMRAQAPSTASPIEQLLAPVRQLEDENRRYRAALDQIRQVVEGVGW